MRRDTKRFKKASEGFKKRVAQHVLDNGGKYREPLPKRGDLGIFMVIDTPVGGLKISIYEDWIAQQFDDEKAAHQFTKKYCSYYQTSNPHSGKCNFHYGISKCEELEDVLLERDWQQWLSKVLSGFPKFEHLSEREKAVLRSALFYMLGNLDDLNEAYAECCEDSGEEPLSFEESEIIALQEVLDQ